MENAFVGGALAFAVGAAVAVGNFLITQKFLKSKNSSLGAVSMIRQLVNVGYFVLLYFLAEHLPWDVFPLLIGGALGITLPMLILTPVLMKKAGSDPSKPKTASDPSEEDSEKKE